MAVSTKLIALGLGALIMCSLIVAFTDAKVIGNGAVKHDNFPCNQHGQNGCLGPPANGYQRGCTDVEKCNRSPGLDDP